MNTRSESRGALMRYGVAVIATAVGGAGALLVRQPFLAFSPFLVFYAAVALSSWYGGTGPGLLAVALGAVITGFVLLTSFGPPPINPIEAMARTVLFVLIGTLIACLNGALLRANERCEREAAIARRSEARVKRLAEANLIGVFFSDMRGSISWANAEMLRLVDCTIERLPTGNVNWQDVTAPDHRHRDQRAVEQLTRNGVCEPYEKDHLLGEKRRVPVLLGCAIVEPPGEEVVGFVLDLTERKRADAEIRQQQQKLQSMASELMMAEERERRRIATVLHDAVVQMLALSKMKVDALRRELSTNGVHRQLNDVYELIDRSIAHTRTLTAELSPPVLYELGLAPAIQWLGDRLRENHNISFTLIDDRKPKPIGDETRLVLFHAVREMLVNIVKHAHATKAEVRISRVEDEIEIVVTDNGRGFTDKPRDYSAGGYGLFNIRQRISHLGGHLELQSEPGAGSTVTLRAPLALPERICP